jgi:D-glycero-alpha-D-manno-heptose-7-phosphate kinase
MSFFGGGTDMEDYFKENGGAVLSTTFDKYCYVNVRHLPRFFDYSTELSYSKIERVTDIDDICHPAVREAMKMLDMHEIRLTYEADLPARSGLGTSSSFAVGMLNAFYALKGKYADKKKLADEAIYLERVLCSEALFSKI